MGRKRQKVAFAKEVTIERRGETAVIEFLDQQYAGTYLTIGPKINNMTDADILRLYNEIVLGQQRMIAESRPREMKEGLPQVGIDPYYKTLITHSETLRCELTSGESHDELVVEIDDKKLSWNEFGKLISPYIGWAMRVQFLPAEQLADPPKPEILTKVPFD